MAGPAHGESFFEGITSWFTGKKADEPIADALPYKVTIKIDHGDSDVRSAIEDSSNLVTLQDSAAPGAAGLVQRALSDQERITAALYDKGYYAGEIDIRIADVDVNDPSVFDAAETMRMRGPVKVQINVDVGPEFRFGKIRVLDAKTRRPMTNVPHLEDSDLVEGEVAASSAIARAERIIVADLRKQGYPFARIDSKDVAADHISRRLEVSLFVESGPKAPFGSFTVSGTEGLDPEFVESRIDIEEGDPYSPERLDKLRKRLTSYPIIAGVKLREADGLDPAGRLPVDVEISERK
ncbi:MAG TPA: POTRA domain-containing protein, partial [Nordella sp.]|nr:POTRA domain-containing protein [Nordella sp.]